MSYILDALKKADRERNLGEVPDLETAHWGVRRQAQRYPWLWVIGALVLLNGLLLALVLVENDERVAVPEPVQEETTVSNLQNSGIVPIPRVAENSGLAETVRPRVPVRPPVVPTTGRAEQSAPQPKPSGQQLQARSSGSGLPAAVPADEFGIPEWRELSLEFRSGFALPRIDVHVYAEQAGRRFIMVDLKKYREGETLASGAVLEKIHPGSIQLNYRGTRFRVDR